MEGDQFRPTEAIFNHHSGIFVMMKQLDLFFFCDITQTLGVSQNTLSCKTIQLLLPLL